MRCTRLDATGARTEWVRINMVRACCMASQPAAIGAPKQARMRAATLFSLVFVLA